MRSTSTSATAATYVRTFSYFTYETPRPRATPPPALRGDGRVSHFAFRAAALSTVAPRASFMCRSLNSMGSTPAAAASSSMNASFA